MDGRASTTLLDRTARTTARHLTKLLETSYSSLNEPLIHLNNAANWSKKQDHL
jgi:hypothetical protein